MKNNLRSPVIAEDLLSYKIGFEPQKLVYTFKLYANWKGTTLKITVIERPCSFTMYVLNQSMLFQNELISCDKIQIKGIDCILNLAGGNAFACITKAKTIVKMD